MEGKITILPYTHINGCPTFTDSELKELYLKVVEQKIEPLLFHDDSINSSAEFIRSTQSNQTLLFVIMLDDTPMGMIWLNRLEKTTAQGHFCYFKEVWGTDNPVRASRKFMELATRILFPTLIGVIPTWNKAAMHHCEKAGFHTLGRVPAMLYSRKDQSPIEAMIYYTNQEDFKNENLQ